ncbi:MAG: Do family serine endopeptidase [Magnetococcales bacterium]|nr:Do family serine endopeptidase [Magnetococcales bacterium]
MRRCGSWLVALSMVGWVVPLDAGWPARVDDQPLPTLAPMLERITPAVVNIATTTRLHIPDHPLLNDPVFRYFFDLPNLGNRREKMQRSLGSGVVVDAQRGYILTNHHVIDKSDTIQVALHDGRQLQAQVVGRDPETDVAVVRIAAQRLTALPMGDSNRLRVGDFVVAIGNPFGLGQTVTSGIVSAMGRSGLGIEGYEDFIQTDASINPGNSGGALVDLRGELIGINTAILARGGGNVGIGFAIPISMARQVMEQLVEYGEVRRGLLGIQTQELTPELAEAFRLDPASGGAVVTRVTGRNGSGDSGLRPGDIIIEANGRKIRNSAALRTVSGLARVGDPIRIKYLRDGKPSETVVTVAPPAQQQQIRGNGLDARLDGSVLELVDGGNGSDLLRVSAIKRDSTAWRIGLRPGDIILAVNQQPVTTLEELKNLASADRKKLLLTIQREQQQLVILVR